jgi:antitoxin CptB
LSQLAWQCRRGMRELDELLLGFLEHRYEDASDLEKQAFRSLLELSDPELMSYLLYQEQPAAELASVVEQLLDRTHS